MAARFAGFMLAASLLLGTAAWAADEDDGYEWSTGSEDGYAYLVYGSPETDEDYGFLMSCDGNNKATGMTVYVDIASTKVGDPVAIAFGGGETALTVQGQIGTDEMSGYLFSEAAGFKIKPVLALLSGEGPVTVKTGAVVTTLPAAGRGKATAEFAKSCPLD